MQIPELLHDHVWQCALADVRQHHDAQFLLGEHPDESAHSIDVAAVLYHEAAFIVAQEPAESVRQGMRPGIDSLPGTVKANDGVRRVHLFDLPFADDLLAAVLSLRELPPDPLRQVHDVRVDGAGRRDVVDVPPRDHADRVLDVGVRRRDVTHRGEPLDARVALRHAERREDATLDEVIPGRVRDAGSKLSGGKVHQVLIAELRPEAPRGREESRPTHDLIAVELAAVPEHVPASETAAVTEEVADAELARGIGIEDVKAGEILFGRIVPRHLLFVDQKRDAGGGERLRRRADREHRPIGHAVRLRDVLDAIAPRVDDRVVAHDRDRDPGNLPRLACGLDVGVEPGIRLARLSVQADRCDQDDRDQRMDEVFASHDGLSETSELWLVEMATATSTAFYRRGRRDRGGTATVNLKLYACQQKLLPLRSR